MLINRLRLCFGSGSLNLRVPLMDPYTGALTDEYLNKYHLVYSAFLYKRRVLRTEVWPKMHVIQESPRERVHLDCQKLIPMRKSMRDSTMQKLIQGGLENIDSAFVVSVFAEEAFKELMDQYLSKSLVCGKAPADPKAQVEVDSQVMRLYDTFYNGEDLSPLEREIQQRYLAEKQNKFNRYNSTVKKNAYWRCMWRTQDQRLLEEMKNFHRADYHLSDVNYRPFFRGTDASERASSVQAFHFDLLGQQTPWEKRKFKRTVAPYYDESNKRFFQWVAQRLFVRTVYWLRSQEFKEVLQIQPDHTFQLSILYLHLWLIIQRLNSGSATSQSVARELMQELDDELGNQARGIQVRSPSGRALDLYRLLRETDKILKWHFQQNQGTKINPYVGFDALLWSICFYQKIDRYDDSVYFLSEYIIKNREYLSQQSQTAILNGLIEFDVFVMDPNLRMTISEINKPLSAKQLLAQMKQSNVPKKHSYNYLFPSAVLPMSTRAAERPMPSIAKLIKPIFKFFFKYSTLTSMDRVFEMERVQKIEKEQQKVSVWKVTGDSSEKSFERQLNDAKTLRLSKKSKKNKATNQNGTNLDY